MPTPSDIPATPATLPDDATRSGADDPHVDPGLDPLASLVASLRRWPDVEGADLLAVDGAERLLLDEVAALPDALAQVVRTTPGALVTLDDPHGGLTLGAVTLGAARPRAWQDSVVAERALDANADRLGLAGTYDRPAPHVDEGSDLVGRATLGGARVVLLRLPRSLDALTELAESVARHADPDVVLLAAGMTKHMTHAMNDVLAASFTQVRATRGRFKARALVATGPRRDVARSFPTTSRVPDAPGGPLVLHAHGAAFAGPRLDRGARFLLEQLAAAWAPGEVVAATGAVLDEATGTVAAQVADQGADAVPDDVARELTDRLARGWGDVRDVVDLGCGTGALAVSVARALPGARVVATDVSAAAVASTRLTARAAGVDARVVTLRDDAAQSLPDASADVVLCNPPFHVGSTLHTGVASRMFRAAARLLRPGGTLWAVYNSPLAYRTELERVVGRTTQVARNPTFTVTRSTRRA